MKKRKVSYSVRKKNKFYFLKVIFLFTPSKDNKEDIKEKAATVEEKKENLKTVSKKETF